MVALDGSKDRIRPPGRAVEAMERSPLASDTLALDERATNPMAIDGGIPAFALPPFQQGSGETVRRASEQGHGYGRKHAQARMISIPPSGISVANNARPDGLGGKYMCIDSGSILRLGLSAEPSSTSSLHVYRFSEVAVKLEDASSSSLPAFVPAFHGLLFLLLSPSTLPHSQRKRRPLSHRRGKLCVPYSLDILSTDRGLLSLLHGLV
ncbi:hypothetical protein C8R46DRAFT_1216573 [Mycena filopes]|nr:hypothetical protein C8R46DRAFT_1216573 [Mycena filopes]